MDGTKRHARWGAAVAASMLLMLALAASAWAAPGVDAFENAGSAPLPIGKFDEPITDLSTFTTQATAAGAELLTASNTPRWCVKNGLYAYADKTAWFALRGTGRPVAVSASSSGAQKMQLILGIYDAAPFGTGLSQLKGCDFDATFAGGDATVRFDTIAARTYWVQVGACADYNGSGYEWCNPHAGGVPQALVIALSAAPPANDARANAAPLVPGTVYENHGAGNESEINACNGQPYGATVWFNWTAPTWGTAVFDLNGMEGFVSIRRQGSDAVAGCGAARAEASVAKGETVSVQVGT